MTDFPLLKLNDPTIVERKKERPPFPPLSQEQIQKRHATAQTLRNQVEKAVKEIKQYTPEQLRAIFYKIKHTGNKINLTGTGLKTIATGGGVTIATVKDQKFEGMLKKINEFDSAPVKNGHIKHESLVFGIEEFERADPKDRLSTQLYEHYSELVKEESLLLEVELQTLLTGKNQRVAELTTLIGKLKTAIGLNGTIYEHEIMGDCARVVLRCSGDRFKVLVEDAYWQTRAVWFEEQPQFETFKTTLSTVSVDNLGAIIEPGLDDETICVIDSGVNPENALIDPAAKREELISFIDDKEDTSDSTGHGTGVASIAAFGQLYLAKGDENRAKCWITSAKILDDSNRVRARLLSMVLEEIVDHFSKLGVRIFNISACVENRRWNEIDRRTVKRNSWVARKLDQLSRLYDVVFVVSSGNLTQPDVNAYLSSGGDYPNYFHLHETTLLDPAQAALVLTVGSIAPGTTVAGAHATPVAQRFQASPFTRVGPGMLGEIKPELVDYGGNWVRTEQNRVTTNIGTNVMMANSKLTPLIQHAAGTSYSAPKVSHKLAETLASLKRLGFENPSSSLLRAILVNSAKYERTGTEGDEFEQLMEEFSSVNSFAMLMGYGTADSSRTTFDDEYTAIACYDGVLEPNQIAYFRIPVPESIGQAKGEKRLTVTVAFAPKVQSLGVKDYLGTRLKWRLFRGDSDIDKVIEAMSADNEDEAEEVVSFEDRDETFSLWELDEEEDEEEEITEGGIVELTKGRYGINQRSKGTIQHDVFKWKRHSKDLSANDYLLAVASYKREWCSENAPFAVVVRLEETTKSQPIRSDVEAAIEEARAEIEAEAM